MRPEIAKAAARVGWTEQYLCRLNAVLHSSEATAIGGYCVGVLDAVCRRKFHREPSLQELVKAMRCESVSQVSRIFREITE